MFIATNKNGEKISISNANKNGNYLCPVCCGEVIYRNCKTKASHFAHKRKSDCDDWGDMSEWHLGWQEKFPIECREVAIEKDGVKHRADVLVKEKNTIIEFQHSSISNEDFNARNKFYTGNGYNLIWIFDGEKKIKKPDNYECDFNKINNIYGFKDQTLEWKRYKKDEELLRTDIRLQVFYEVYMEKLSKKVLLPLSRYDNFELKFYWTYDYIYEESFLKNYSSIYKDIPARSFEEIMFYTQEFLKINKIDEQIAIRAMNRYKTTYSMPVRRHFHF